jgi:soluble lytic murein transglycosylase
VDDLLAFARLEWDEEARVSPKSRTWAARGLWASLGWLAQAALFGCSGQPAPVQSHGIRTPLGPGVPRVSAASGLRPVPSAATPEPVEAAPLLLDPRLMAVAQAVEANSPRSGALALEQVMAKANLTADQAMRWQFLLGRLREKAGEPRASLAAYRLAAAEDWPLRDYARLGAARALVSTGELGAARTELERITAGPPLGTDVRLLTAEIALLEHDLDRAVDALKGELGKPGRKPERASTELRLAQALLERASVPSRASSAAAQTDCEQALELARAVRCERPLDPMAIRAERLEKQILDALPEPARARLRVLTLEEELARLRGLVNARLEDAAEQVALALLARLPPGARWQELGCEAALLGAKAVALKKKPDRALDFLIEPLRRCQGDDWRARALYLAGTYAAQDGRHMQAVRYFEELERAFPTHSLADDARLKAALGYFELGVEAEFTRLLSRLPEDYPGGDMVLDGIFRLALRRIEKCDWPGAASVLERAQLLARDREYTRGTEYSGRERYFLARAAIQTGDTARGYDQLAEIVRELPLSYYMLHAYSRLKAVDPERAARAREEGCRRSNEDPFAIGPQPAFEQPGFLRAKELLWVGEVELGHREIQELGLVQAGSAPEILWGVTLLYARAGAAKLSHTLARGLLTDWLRHWPVGDWVHAWQLGFPRPFASVVQREARKNQLPESLVYAVMREESAFDPDAVSPADAHGLMQLIVPTAKIHARPLGLPFDARSLKSPAINLALGCRVLGRLREKFPNNPLLAIPGYNAGPGRPARWLRERPDQDFDLWVELIPFHETRRYTKRVLASRAAYAYLYESPNSDDPLLLPVKVASDVLGPVESSP